MRISSSKAKTGLKKWTITIRCSDSNCSEWSRQQHWEHMVVAREDEEIDYDTIIGGSSDV